MFKLFFLTSQFRILFITFFVCNSQSACCFVSISKCELWQWFYISVFFSLLILWHFIYCDVTIKIDHSHLTASESLSVCVCKLHLAKALIYSTLGRETHCIFFLLGCSLLHSIDKSMKIINLWAVSLIDSRRWHWKCICWINWKHLGQVHFYDLYI